MHPFDFSHYFHDNLDIVSDFVSRYHTFDKHKEHSNMDLRQIYFDEDHNTFVCPYCGKAFAENPATNTTCPTCNETMQPY